MRNCKFFSLSFLILIINVSIANTKPILNILGYDISSYPTVKSRYFYFDNIGIPLNNLSNSDFTITDNGVILSASLQNCNSQNPFEKISVVLSIDLSPNSTQNNSFTKAVKFAKEFIANITNYNAECAITSFDVLSYLNQDFSIDKNLLINAASLLNPHEGSELDSGFLINPSGSIDIAKRSLNQKSIILLTYGTTKINADSIITEANSNKIRIFPVIFGDSISPDLQKIALQTGGFAFNISENVINYTGIIFSIFAISKNYTPCNLLWINKLDCNAIHTVNITVLKDSVNSDITINVPENIKPGLEDDPQYLRFSSTLPGTSKSLYLTMTAQTGDITISKLFIQNPKFSIDSGDIKSPITLLKDNSYTIKIKFTPTDSAIVFDSLQIISNACLGSTVLITGGYPNTPPNERTLTLLSPKCYDKFITGDTVTVSWTGLLPADVIQLQYSINDGISWDTLASDITGLNYKWVVPDKPSDSCLVRIIQIWPNNIGSTLVLRHKGGVNCANFNGDGSLVITASEDQTNTVRIWNANDGQLKMELPGHKSAINWVNFDKQDLYAVSASDDSTAIIWDLKNGQVYKVLSSHHGVVRSANFSTDGKQIVTASSDGWVYIWDVITGSKIDSLSDSGVEFWYACYSPDTASRYILTTDNIGRAITWDTQNNKSQKVFDSKKGVVPYASFSYDLKKIATANWFGYAEVWDFNTGAELFSVKHDSISVIPINSANFDETGDLLLTAGTDTIPRLWDGNTGKPITTLSNEHSSSVQTASFNFDGKRILTASWDSTAKVWNRTQIGLQIDTTKCIFSITNLKVNVQDIKFPPISIYDVYDSIVNPFIKNLLSFPVFVKNYSISGNNPDDFEIIDNLAPFQLDSLGSNSIGIRFKPTGTGLRTANIEIELPGKTITAKLSGESLTQGLQPANSVIDFKQVEIGDFKDTFNIAIKNVSQQDIKINNFNKIGPDLKHFNIIAGGDSTTIKSGQIHYMTIRFSPESTGRQNCVVSIQDNYDKTPVSLSLFGEGILPVIDTVAISVSNISGNPGDIINLPIRIKNIGINGIASTITGFSGVLSFNSTLLEPIDGNYGNDIVNDVRNINVALSSAFTSDSIIGNVKFKAGLGDDTVSSLIINNLTAIGKGRIVINSEQGIFQLTGYCTQGGTRLFNSNGILSLSQIVPNPVTSGMSTIHYEIIEKGPTKLYIVDVLGNTVMNLVSKNLSVGSYSVDFNTGELPSGEFFYILETPTQRIVKIMEVVK